MATAGQIVPKDQIKCALSEIIREADGKIKNEYYAAVLPPFEYRVVTMNMNGPTDKGYIDSRRLLVTKILSECNPDIVFCQELPDKFNGDVIQKLDPGDQLWNYEWTENEREAGIMWNKTKFDGVKVKLSDRACFVKLTTKDSPQRSFIVVSYHGEHNCTEETKKKQFSTLIESVRAVDRDSPFLIGGDFNFNTLKEEYLDWVTSLHTAAGETNYSPDKVVPAGYNISSTMASSMRKKTKTTPYKDNFYWDPNKSITMYLEWARPFVFVRGDDCDLSDEKLKAVEAHSDVLEHKIKVQDLLDHDPIFGILKWRDQNPNQNLDQLQVDERKEDENITQELAKLKLKDK